MKRVAYKRAPARPSRYGDNERKERRTTSSGTERARLMYKSMQAMFEGKKMSAIDRRRLDELNAREEREEYARRLDVLFRRMPVLKEVKASLPSDTFERLVKSMLKELDRAIEKGFDEKPGYSAPSGNSGRGDTWTCAPGTHGTSCPCVGPHIPGPSGLY